MSDTSENQYILIHIVPNTEEIGKSLPMRLTATLVTKRQSEFYVSDLGYAFTRAVETAKAVKVANKSLGDWPTSFSTMTHVHRVLPTAILMGSASSEQCVLAELEDFFGGCYRVVGTNFQTLVLLAGMYKRTGRECPFTFPWELIGTPVEWGFERLSRHKFIGNEKEDLVTIEGLLFDDTEQAEALLGVIKARVEAEAERLRLEAEQRKRDSGRDM
jgi:hypothetical protein